jgi:hypothetical protein
MEGGGFVVVAWVAGAGVSGVVDGPVVVVVVEGPVVVVVVDGAVVVVVGGAISSLGGAVLVVDFDVGGWEAAGFEAGGLDAGDADGVGATDGCPAAILNAASDSATKQAGRSTRFM